jgi:hypothetical protein
LIVAANVLRLVSLVSPSAMHHTPKSERDSSLERG